MKRRRKKWNKEREKGQEGGGGGVGRSRNGTARHKNSLGGSAAEMLQDPKGWANSAPS